MVCGPNSPPEIVTTLTGRLGVVAITNGETSDGLDRTADVAREATDGILDALRELDAHTTGMITLAPLDTAIGALATKAEKDAPGEEPTPSSGTTSPHARARTRR